MKLGRRPSALNRVFKRTRVYKHPQAGARSSILRRRFVIFGGIFILAGSVAFPLLHENEARAWWNTDYQYRRKITFNTSTVGGSALANFPIRVSLTSSRITYANAQSAGQDIRFVDNDDSTPLDYEIEQWNNGGTSDIWVRKPSLAVGVTTDFIYMYYGNSTVKDGANPRGVWDSNYFLVHHANDAANSGSINDSTSNDFHGAPNLIGHPVATTSGKIAGAQNYILANANDWYKMAQHATILDTFTNSSFSIQAWAKPTSTPGSSKEFSVAGKRGKYAGLQISSGLKAWGVTRDSTGSTTRVAAGATTLTTGNWYFIEQVVNTSTLVNTIYLNGTSDGTITFTTLYNYYPTDSDSSQVVVVGKGDPGTACTSNFAYCMDGSIDEVRFSNIARTADWVKADYLTESDTMNTYPASDEILPPDKPILTSPGIATALNPVFQLRASDQHSPNYLRYKIQVCDDAACSTVLGTDDQTSSQTGWSGQDSQTSTAYVASATLASSTLATHTYQGSALTAGRAYWWRAAAIDPGDSQTWSDWSDIDTFTTEGPPKAPTLITPANGATNVPVNSNTRFELVTWDVNASNVKYKIELCTVSNCIPVSQTFDQVTTQAGWTAQAGNSATTYFTDSVSTANSQVAIYFTQAQLSPNTTYYWQASATDAGGTGPTSTISSFTTANTSGAGNVKTRITGGTVITGGTNF